MSDHDQPVAANVVDRQFTADRPNHLSAVNDRHLTIKALEMAIKRRCPETGYSTTRIYVGSGDVSSVTVIDGATHATVDLAGPWQPGLLAVNTVTNTVYASGLQTGGGIMVIDGATNAVTVVSTPIPSWGYVSLGAPRVNERTNTVYLVDASTNSLLVLDGATNGLTSQGFDYMPCAVAVNPSNNKVYVSHCSDSRISILDR
jgi:DNA-binding beta-propeller fold protein YncE